MSENLIKFLDWRPIRKTRKLLANIIEWILLKIYRLSRRKINCFKIQELGSWLRDPYF